MRLGCVDRHIERTEVKLAKVKQRVVDVLGPDQLLNEIIRDRLSRDVVLAQPLQLRRSPAPVLQHLAGCLDKVAHDARAVEARVLRAANEIVDSVAQLVEERDNLIVLEERWLIGRRLGEVAYERCGRVTACAVCGHEAALEVEVGGVAVLSRAGVQVQVEVA